MNRFRRLLSLIVLTVIATGGASAVGPVAAGAITTAPAAVGSIAITSHGANRIVQSTGNLYWTENQSASSGFQTSLVWRASKSNTPGHEIPLYSETRTGRFSFGDVVWAKVGTTFYGYFVANYDDLGVSYIKRIHLSPGTGVTLATTTNMIGTRDLATDGTNLYWADANGLRKMSIGGGPVQTLRSGTTFTRVGLDATRVFYSSGASIYSVPKVGGTSTTQVTGDTTVTSLFVQTSPFTVIHWGEHGGAVRSKSTLSGSITTTHQSTSFTRSVTSVSFDGSHVLWTDCSASNCSVRSQSGNSAPVLLDIACCGVMREVLGDATATFWTDGSTIRKHAT
jgi:hypothetical protein